MCGGVSGIQWLCCLSTAVTSHDKVLLMYRACFGVLDMRSRFGDSGLSACMAEEDPGEEQRDTIMVGKQLSDSCTVGFRRD